MFSTTIFNVDTRRTPPDFDAIFHAAFTKKEESFIYKETTFDINYNPGQGFVTVSVDRIPKRIPKVFGKRKGLWFSEVSIHTGATDLETLLVKPGSYAKALTDAEGNPRPGIHALADPKGEHESNEYKRSIVIVWGKEFEEVVEYYNELMTGTLEPHSPLT
jgi:hypothetical protein